MLEFVAFLRDSLDQEPLLAAQLNQLIGTQGTPSGERLDIAITQIPETESVGVQDLQNANIMFSSRNDNLRGIESRKITFQSNEKEKQSSFYPNPDLLYTSNSNNLNNCQDLMLKSCAPGQKNSLKNYKYIDQADSVQSIEHEVV